MSDKELFEKRAKPAFDRMYAKAESAYPGGMEITFDLLSRVQKMLGRPLDFPYDAFYIPSDEFKVICEDACKGLRSHWVFPYKINPVLSDDDVERMKEQLAKSTPGSIGHTILQDRIDSNESNRKHLEEWQAYRGELEAILDKVRNKEIRKSEGTKLKNALAKKYGCRKRCADAEKINFFLALDSPTPTSSYETFSKIKGLYSVMSERISDGYSLDDAISSLGELRPDIARTLSNMYVFKKITDYIGK